MLGRVFEDLSCYCWCSQLQPYGFGDIHWAAAHVLAMTGAFFGCLLVSAYEFEGLVNGAHLGDGYRIEGVGLVLATKEITLCLQLLRFQKLQCYALRWLSEASRLLPDTV